MLAAGVIITIAHHRFCGFRDMYPSFVSNLFLIKGLTVIDSATLLLPLGAKELQLKSSSLSDWSLQN